MILSDQQKEHAVTLFKSVQDRLGQVFENIDGKASFVRNDWTREASGPLKSGGGTIGILRGAIVEKAAANVSAVNGDSYPSIESQHQGKPFFAAGVSTICHMYSPHCPIAHMNVRVLDVGDTFWVGGGADLTPFLEYKDDTEQFHEALRDACKQQGSQAYEKYSKWCDEYFYIKHRQSPRGVGGIFYDYLEGDFDLLLQFHAAVTDAYLDVYPKILKRRVGLEFTDEQKDGQLYWRGRYAEFNLVWDRGTKFGLMSGGNTEAILVSMPPVVKW